MRLMVAVVGSLLALSLSFFLCTCHKSTQKYPETSKKVPSRHFNLLPQGVVATWSRNGSKGISCSSAGHPVSAIFENGLRPPQVRASVHSHRILLKEGYGQKGPDIYPSRSAEILLEQSLARRTPQGPLFAMNRTDTGRVAAESGFDCQGLEMDPVNPDSLEVFDQGSSDGTGSSFYPPDFGSDRGCFEDFTKDPGGLTWDE